MKSFHWLTKFCRCNPHRIYQGKINGVGQTRKGPIVQLERVKSVNNVHNHQSSNKGYMPLKFFDTIVFDVHLYKQTNKRLKLWFVISWNLPTESKNETANKMSIQQNHCQTCDSKLTKELKSKNEKTERNK